MRNGDTEMKSCNNSSAASTGSATNSTTIQITQDDLNLCGQAPAEIKDTTVAAILATAYFIAGIAAVIMIIIGGIKYAAANGDSGSVQSAKNTILYAVVGLIVVIMAAAITNYVITNIGK